MAKYDNTKLFWVQLKEDFYDDDAIQWIEEQPDGEKYSNFYLKLCLKSLKTGGFLIRQVGTMLIPYNAEALKNLTKTKSIDTVVVAMKLLEQSGLIKMLEDGTIYISKLQTMIGCTTISAIKKQEQLSQRVEQNALGGTGVEKIPPKIDIDIDLNKDIKEYKEKTKPVKPLLNQQNVKSLEIFDYWNAKNIIKHSTLNDSIEKSILNILKTQSVENIKTMIDRYSIVINQSKYFFKYKWALKDFLSRKSGVLDFADDGSKWLSYCEWCKNNGIENQSEVKIDKNGVISL